MSTHGVIAFAQGSSLQTGFWEGRLQSSDAYPSGLGKALWEQFRGHFGRDFNAALRAKLAAQVKDGMTEDVLRRSALAGLFAIGREFRDE